MSRKALPTNGVGAVARSSARVAKKKRGSLRAKRRSAKQKKPEEVIKLAAGMIAASAPEARKLVMEQAGVTPPPKEYPPLPPWMARMSQTEAAAYRSQVFARADWLEQQNVSKEMWRDMLNYAAEGQTWPPPQVYRWVVHVKTPDDAASTAVAKPDAPPHCIDCKFFAKSDPTYPPRLGHCTHPDSYDAPDAVSGHRSENYCSVVRLDCKPPLLKCGPMGRWFEPRDEMGAEPKAEPHKPFWNVITVKLFNSFRGRP